MPNVRNNDTRQYRIPATLSAPETGDRMAEEIILNPGTVTEVDAEAWTAAKKIFVVGALLKEGQLEEVSGGEAAAAKSTGSTAAPSTGSTAAPPSGEPEDLSSMTVVEASELIAKTSDRATLDRWADADERKGVQDAIEKRIDELDAEEEEP